MKQEMKLGPITRTTSSTLLLKRSQSNDNVFFDIVPEDDVAFDATTTTMTIGTNQRRSLPSRPNKSNLRRTKSEAVVAAARHVPTTTTKNNMNNNASSNVQCSTGLSSVPQQKQHGIIVPPQPTSKLVLKPAVATTAGSKKASTKQQKHFDVIQCGDRTRAILKEYFVSGDQSEAVSLIAEMVHINADGHIQRGTAVLSSGIFLVLEMKEVNVRKFLDVISKCLDDQKLNKASFIPALIEPLEFLRDIEIDAPQAPKLLAIVIANWLTKKVDDGETPIDSLEFLLNSSENFLRDGYPAKFAILIIREGDGDISEADIKLIQSLMTQDEICNYKNAREFLNKAIL